MIVAEAMGGLPDPVMQGAGMGVTLGRATHPYFVYDFGHPALAIGAAAISAGGAFGQARAAIGRRRRMAAPASPKPAIISAQAAGSGTPVVGIGDASRRTLSKLTWR